MELLSSSIRVITDEEATPIFIGFVFLFGMIFWVVTLILILARKKR